MAARTVQTINSAQPTIEGAGVRLNRVIGYSDSVPFDPFLMLDDFSSDEPADFKAGFPWHPHRGITTVTYILEGRVEHKDSLGNAGVIEAGDAQWMTAGSGIIHQEMPDPSAGGLKGFQLWINLPRAHKMTAPQYRDIKREEIPVVEKDGAEVRVLAGEFSGSVGPAHELVVPVVYLDVTLARGRTFEYVIPENDTLFLYVVAGSMSVGDDAIEAGEVARTSAGDTISVTAGEDAARFLLVSGTPLREPVVWRGPVVMNTKEEVEKAFEEVENGTFVKESAEESAA